MKITLKLPGGGCLIYEKKPMSEDARFELMMALLFSGFLLFMLLMFWILK